MTHEERCAALVVLCWLAAIHGLVAGVVIGSIPVILLGGVLGWATSILYILIVPRNQSDDDE